MRREIAFFKNNSFSEKMILFAFSIDPYILISQGIWRFFVEFFKYETCECDYVECEISLHCVLTVSLFLCDSRCTDISNCYVALPEIERLKAGCVERQIADGRLEKTRGGYVGDGAGRKLYSLPGIEGLIRIAARNRALLSMVTRSLIRGR